MTNAAYSRPGTASATNAYKETVSYDINGNIATMVRNGNSETGVQPFEMDDLVYVYERGTNKLMQVYDDSASPLGFKDDVNGTPDTDYDYGYDNRGNMTSDQNKGITAITYNHLNLPVEITFSGTNRKITYIYTATGEKVRKIVNDNSEGVTTDYLDGFQYRDGKMQLFPTSEGYVSNTRANGHNNYRYVYNYTDHLGNVRLSYGKNENDELKIMEENHYYPYGLKHTNYNTDQKEYGKSEQGEQVLLKAPPGGNATVNEVYKYKYNGCEYQDELGLNLYDMDMRDYDPATARWTGIDPITHFDQSPYMAMNGNPVLFADPSGADGIGGEVWSQSFGSIYSTPYNGAGANFSGQYGGSIKPVESLGVGTGVIRVGGPIFWGSLSSQSNQTYEAQILRNNYSTTNKAAIKRIYNHFARAYGYPASKSKFRAEVDVMYWRNVKNDYNGEAGSYGGNNTNSYLTHENIAYLGIGMIVVGGVLTLTGVGAEVGVPLMALGDNLMIANTIEKDGSKFIAGELTVQEFATDTALIAVPKGIESAVEMEAAPALMLQLGAFGSEQWIEKMNELNH